MEDREEGKKLVEWLSEKLGIGSLSDWYRISMKQVNELVLMENASMLAQILRRSYPQHNWDDNKLSRLGPVKSSQRQLVLAAKELFPTYRKAHAFYT